jgi:hypothetical protein
MPEQKQESDQTKRGNKDWERAKRNEKHKHTNKSRKIYAADEGKGKKINNARKENQGKKEQEEWKQKRRTAHKCKAHKNSGRKSTGKQRTENKKKREKRKEPTRTNIRKEWNLNKSNGTKRKK